MLVEMAIGDAYGAGFEYAPADFVRRYNDLSHYVQHPRHPLPPGNYTDDTQMGLAVTEAIIDGDAWTPQRLAERFVDAFHRGPRPGYAKGFHQLLQQIDSGNELLARIRPRSDKTGAAMRAPPIGVFTDPQEVIERAAVQAAITHDTDTGRRAAQASALCLHFCHHRRGPLTDLGRFLDHHVAGDWTPVWRGKVGSRGWMAVRAAVTALMEGQSQADVLRRCVAYTGDTDTVAAIAMPAAASSAELASDLPTPLVDHLEDDPYGLTYLRGVDSAWQAE
mgnify:CR=1 FL=1